MPIQTSIAALEPLRVALVEKSESGLFRQLIQRYHYLGHRTPVGAHLRYFVKSAHDQILACLLWTSPAWKMAARDLWIGWSCEQRRRNLQYILNNGRFLILPWAHVKGLASKILARSARQVPQDWRQHYGYKPSSGGSWLVRPIPNAEHKRNSDRRSTEGRRSASADAEPEPCENCGRPMTLKRGRFGQFLACTGYPECKTTRKLAPGTKTPKKSDVMLEETCPQWGTAKLAVKEGRFGEFIACSNYPKYKYIKPKTVGGACPKPACGGELIERRSKRGKVFYGCLKYPDCDFAAWNKPVPEPCPQCGAPFLLEKSTKREGLIRYCNEESCAYKVPVEAEKVS